jgi:hypothetical protein
MNSVRGRTDRRMRIGQDIRIAPDVKTSLPDQDSAEASFSGI